MFDELKYIELSGKKIPYKCDMFVLEQIQEEYGDLSEFENKLTGFVPSVDEEGNIIRNEDGYVMGTYKIPEIKTMKKALAWMVKEGLEIEKEEKGIQTEEIEEKTLVRMVDMPPGELGKKLHEEFNRCFQRKNEQTTQSSKTKKKE